MSTHKSWPKTEEGRLARNEYNRTWYKSNREAHISLVQENKKVAIQKLNELKLQPCTDCGFIPEDACQMDYDHVRGAKVNHLSYLVRRGNWKTVLDEIDKCELVCANCHRLRTQKRYALRGASSGS